MEKVSSTSPSCTNYPCEEQKLLANLLGSALANVGM